MLLQVLRGVFRQAHLSSLNQGPLTVMLFLADQEQTCIEIAEESGYDRSTVRQILQLLKQLGDVDMRPFRSSGHGQVEYIYTLTKKGSEILKRCLGDADVLMARLALGENAAALGENAAALGDAGKEPEEENAESGKGKKDGGKGENGKPDSLLV